MSWDEILAIVILLVGLVGAVYVWSRVRPPGVDDSPETSRREVFKQARERWRRKRDAGRPGD